MKERIKGFFRDEDGFSLIAATPWLLLLFLGFGALTLSAGVTALKKQELQIVADCAARAGTRAILEDECYVVKDDYGHHCYVVLEPGKATSNAKRVMDAYMKANYSGNDSFTINGWDLSPAYGHRFPEYNAAAGDYIYRYMSEDEMYYSGNYAVELWGTSETIWSGLLGTRGRASLHAYGAAQASGQAVDRNGNLLPGK